MTVLPDARNREVAGSDSVAAVVERGLILTANA
jgi:hypothetical protein